MKESLRMKKSILLLSIFFLCLLLVSCKSKEERAMDAYEQVWEETTDEFEDVYKDEYKRQMDNYEQEYKKQMNNYEREMKKYGY